MVSITSDECSTNLTLVFTQAPPLTRRGPLKNPKIHRVHILKFVVPCSRTYTFHLTSTQMIKLYGPKPSCFRCLWTLEEVGAEYEHVFLDMTKKEHKDPNYMKLNPNGKVPTLVDGDFVLWESIAINNYVTEKFNSDLRGVSLEERSQVSQWVLWSIIHLYGSLSVLSMQQWRNTPDNDNTKAAREVDLPRWLTVLNGHLEGKTSLVSERFTLADLTAMAVARGIPGVNFDLSPYPNVTAWMERVSERPAYIKISAD